MGIIIKALVAERVFVDVLFLTTCKESVVLRCKPMTATRYASITLSGRVFKLSETTPNILIGRCGKIAPHLHRIQHFSTFIGRVAQKGGLRHNGLAPVEMHGIRISCRS